jgi:hypothetical protein
MDLPVCDAYEISIEKRKKKGMKKNNKLVSSCMAVVANINSPTGFSESATFEDLRNADCTSCAVAEDMSAYWAPALYFKHLNGSYQEVQQDGGMLA